MQRRGHTAVPLASGELLVVGGYMFNDPSGSPLRAERYDPVTGTWSTVADTLHWHAAEDHGVLLPGGAVLIVGLEGEERYDPATDTWENLPWPTGAAISNSTVTQLADGDVLIAGGMMDLDAWGTAVRLDGVSLEIQVSQMNTARGYHSASLLADGRVLVAGGQRFIDELEQFESLALAELYDPATNTWTTVAAMAEARRGHRAVGLGDGRALVTGGLGASSTEFYDPMTDTWTAGPSMTTARGGHTLTALPSGWLLAVGGADGEVQASVEAYDPATETWIPAPSLNQARMDHTATYLPDVGVLVTGGGTHRYNFNTGVASAELYPLGGVAAGEVCLIPDECTSGLCSNGVCSEQEQDPGDPGDPGEPCHGCPFDADSDPQPANGALVVLVPGLLFLKRRRRSH